MNKESVKKGFQLAQKELEEKQINEVKKIVKKTLEKIDCLKSKRDKFKEQIIGIDKDLKILKMDIDDLKDGKLDRMVERQEKDEEAKKVSVVVIIKEKVIEREVPRWYYPYTVIWQEPIVEYKQPGLCPSVWNMDNSITLGNSISSNDCSSFSNSVITYTINNSIAKDACIGTYDINGHIVHLR